MKNVFLITCFLVLISACNTPQEKINTTDIDFNYIKLLDQEIKNLSNMHAGLQKSIYYQGKNEKKTIDAPDWDKELRPFFQCNIQTPAFNKLYSESRRVSGDSLILVYTARTDKSEVRRLEIYLLRLKLDSIRAELFRQNSYFTLNETLQYAPDYGYLISGSQKMMFASETVYRIEARLMLPS